MKKSNAPLMIFLIYSNFWETANEFVLNLNAKSLVLTLINQSKKNYESRVPTCSMCSVLNNCKYNSIVDVKECIGVFVNSLIIVLLNIE